MKRYHVIKKQSSNNEHINELDLLPASCRLITGIAVCATVKKNAEAVEFSQAISFPQHLIKRLLAQESIQSLPYAEMQALPTLEESKAYFEAEILPSLVNTLVDGINYPVLTLEQQNDLSSKIHTLLMGGSQQEAIDWAQREQDLKAEYRRLFFDFMTLNYEPYGINPEEDIQERYLDLLFIPVSRTYALSRITYDLYYQLGNAYYESYSELLQDISTNGNSIMQDFDYALLQLQAEQKAYDELETSGLVHHLYSKADLFTQGQQLGNIAFADLIASETLMFLYQNKSNLFLRPVQTYKRPDAYECGALSLLVNGNSFLLRDFILTANRRIKHLSKELIPFNEPLEVNSNLQTLYKSKLKSGYEPVNIRIYIEYEDFKETDKGDNKEL